MKSIQKTLAAAAVGFAGMIGSAAAQEDPSQTELFNQFAACYETENEKVDQDIARQRTEQIARYEAMSDAEIDGMYAELAGITDLTEDQMRRIYGGLPESKKIYFLAELTVASAFTANELLDLTLQESDRLMDQAAAELQNKSAEELDGIFEQALPGAVATLNEATSLAVASMPREQKISELVDQMTFTYKNPAVLCAEQLGIDNATAYDWQDKTLRQMMDRQFLSP